MAMMIPSEDVRKLFLVLTGEEWPTANEDELLALALVWTAAAQVLGTDLGPALATAVNRIRAEFSGKAERRFADRMAPYVVEDPRYVQSAAQQFATLAAFLQKTGLEVQYIKLVSIIELITLLAEMAWAAAAAFFTGGGSLQWLAARMAIVRFLLRTRLGHLLARIVEAQVYGIAFEAAVDVLAQAVQFAMGTRTEWDWRLTTQTIAVGSIGGLLALPFAAMGHLLSKKLIDALSTVAGPRIGRGDLAAAVQAAVATHIREVGDKPFREISQKIAVDIRKATDNAVAKSWAGTGSRALAEFVEEGLHEMTTETLYILAAEGRLDINPYSLTAGAFSGLTSGLGADLAQKLRGATVPGPADDRAPAYDDEPPPAYPGTGRGLAPPQVGADGASGDRYRSGVTVPGLAPGGTPSSSGGTPSNPAGTPAVAGSGTATNSDRTDWTAGPPPYDPATAPDPTPTTTPDTTDLRHSAGWSPPPSVTRDAPAPSTEGSPTARSVGLTDTAASATGRTVPPLAGKAGPLVPTDAGGLTAPDLPAPAGRPTAAVGRSADGAPDNTTADSTGDAASAAGGATKGVHRVVGSMLTTSDIGSDPVSPFGHRTSDSLTVAPGPASDGAQVTEQDTEPSTRTGGDNDSSGAGHSTGTPSGHGIDTTAVSDTAPPASRSADGTTTRGNVVPDSVAGPLAPSLVAPPAPTTARTAPTTPTVPTTATVPITSDPAAVPIIPAAATGPITSATPAADRFPAVPVAPPGPRAQDTVLPAATFDVPAAVARDSVVIRVPAGAPIPTTQIAATGGPGARVVLVAEPGATGATGAIPRADVARVARDLDTNVVALVPPVSGTGDPRWTTFSPTARPVPVQLTPPGTAPAHPTAPTTPPPDGGTLDRSTGGSLDNSSSNPDYTRATRPAAVTPPDPTGGRPAAGADPRVPQEVDVRRPSDRQMNGSSLPPVGSTPTTATPTIQTPQAATTPTTPTTTNTPTDAARPTHDPGRPKLGPSTSGVDLGRTLSPAEGPWTAGDIAGPPAPTGDGDPAAGGPHDLDARMVTPPDDPTARVLGPTSPATMGPTRLRAAADDLTGWLHEHDVAVRGRLAGSGAAGRDALALWGSFATATHTAADTAGSLTAQSPPTSIDAVRHDLTSALLLQSRLTADPDIGPVLLPTATDHSRTAADPAPETADMVVGAPPRGTAPADPPGTSGADPSIEVPVAGLPAPSSMAAPSDSADRSGRSEQPVPSGRNGASRMALPGDAGLFRGDSAPSPGAGTHAGDGGGPAVRAVPPAVAPRPVAATGLTVPEVAEVVAEVSRRVPPTPENCLDVVGALLDRFFPQGVAAGRTVDDAAVGTRRGSDQFASPDGWPLIRSWHDVVDAFSGAAPGTVLTVLVQNPGRGPGHAALVYQPDRGDRSGGGPVVLDPIADMPVAQLDSATHALAAPVAARGLFIDPTGRAMPGVLATTPESGSTARSLVDRAVDPDYAGGRRRPAVPDRISVTDPLARTFDAGSPPTADPRRRARPTPPDARRAAASARPVGRRERIPDRNRGNRVGDDRLHRAGFDADPTYSSPRHPGRPGRPADGIEMMPPDVPSAGRATALQEYLDDTRWWQLYIDERDHARALRDYRDNPGILYDHDEEPGFQRSMEEAVREVLAQNTTYQRIDSAQYKRMHEFASRHVRTLQDDGRYEWMGSHWSGRAINDTERWFTVSPLFGAPTYSVENDYVAGRRLLIPADDVTRVDDGQPISYTMPVDGTTQIVASYPAEDAPAIADAIFDLYYDELARAVHSSQQLRAIAGAVRRLHIAHMFSDGNARVNINLLLPRLLMNQGFRPVVFPDMNHSFSGGVPLQELEAHLRRGQLVDTLALPAPAAPSFRSSEADSDPGPYIGGGLGGLVPIGGWTDHATPPGYNPPGFDLGQEFTYGQGTSGDPWWQGAHPDEESIFAFDETVGGPGGPSRLTSSSASNHQQTSWQFNEDDLYGATPLGQQHPGRRRGAGTTDPYGQYGRSDRDDSSGQHQIWRAAVPDGLPSTVRDRAVGDDPATIARQASQLMDWVGRHGPALDRELDRQLPSEPVYDLRELLHAVTGAARHVHAAATDMIDGSSATGMPVVRADLENALLQHDQLTYQAARLGITIPTLPTTPAASPGQPRPPVIGQASNNAAAAEPPSSAATDSRSPQDRAGTAPMPDPVGPSRTGSAAAPTVPPYVAQDSPIVHAPRGRVPTASEIAAVREPGAVRVVLAAGDGAVLPRAEVTRVARELGSDVVALVEPAHGRGEPRWTSFSPTGRPRPVTDPASIPPPPAWSGRSERPLAPGPAAPSPRSAVQPPSAAALDRAGLGAMVNSMVPAGTDQASCLVALNDLRSVLYPRGISTGRTTDDGEVGRRGALAGVADYSWTRVPSWDAVRDLLDRTGPGSAAFVLMGRPGGVGHAFAAYHTSDQGPFWVDLQAAPQRRLLPTGERPSFSTRAPREGRAELESAVDVRVLMVDGTGRAADSQQLTDDAGQPESASTSRALLDSASVDDNGDRWGATGVEVETKVGLVRVIQDGRRVPSGSKLVVSDDITLVIDADESGPIIEITVNPMRNLDGERRFDPAYVLPRLETVLYRLHSLQPGQAIELGPLFPAREGWQVTDNGGIYAAVGATRRPDLYVQYTEDVALEVLPAFLNWLVDRSWAPTASAVLSQGLGFGAALAQEYNWYTGGRASARELGEVNAVGILAYTHTTVMLDAMWNQQIFGRRTLIKNGLVAASRMSMAAVRDAAVPPVQHFLEINRSAIRDRFQTYLFEQTPHMHQLYRQTGLQQADGSLHLLGDLHPQYAKASQYLDNVLLSRPTLAVSGIPLLDQYWMAMHTHYDAFNSDGAVLGGRPMVALEARRVAPMDVPDFATLYDQYRQLSEFVRNLHRSIFP